MGSSYAVLRQMKAVRCLPRRAAVVRAARKHRFVIHRHVLFQSSKWCPPPAAKIIHEGAFPPSRKTANNRNNCQNFRCSAGRNRLVQWLQPSRTHCTRFVIIKSSRPHYQNKCGNVCLEWFMLKSLKGLECPSSIHNGSTPQANLLPLIWIQAGKMIRIRVALESDGIIFATYATVQSTKSPKSFQTNTT